MMEWQPNETEIALVRARSRIFLLIFLFSILFFHIDLVTEIVNDKANILVHTIWYIRIRNFSLESKVRCSWSLCPNISVGIQLDKNQIPNKVYVTTFIFVLAEFQNTHTYIDNIRWWEKSLWRAKWETLCKTTTIRHCCEDRAVFFFSLSIFVNVHISRTMK